MKKIITLFMAMVVAASMFALPKNPVFTGKKTVPAGVEQIKQEKRMMDKLQANRHEAVMQRNFVRPEVAVAKKAPAVTTAKKVTAEGETITLNMDFYVGPEYYPEYGDWYIALGDDEERGIKLDWYAPQGENNDGYVGTFTTEDFEVEYSYMWYYDEWYEEVYVEFEDITMTISLDSVSEYVDVLNLNATILGDDGNTYVVSASKEILTPKETIELTIEEANMVWDADEMVSVLTAKNDQMELSLTYAASWATGPFSMLDVFPEESSVKYNGVALELESLDMLVTATKNEAGAVGYQVELTLVSSEPIQYNVSMFAQLPVVDIVEIEFDNLEIDESSAWDWGWIFLYGSNDEWNLQAGIGDWEMMEGTYAGEEYVMFYLSNMVTDHFAEQVYAELTVTNDPAKGWVIDIVSHCTDNVVYKVHMVKNIPTPTDTVTIRFDKSANAAYYPMMNNDLLLANFNEQFYAGIDVVGVELGGSFTMDDIDPNYTLIFSDYANRVMVNMADLQGSIYQVGDTTFIDAEVIGYDAVLYDVQLWHCVPTPTETVQVEIAAEFINKIENGGYYQLAGYNAENTLYVSLAPLTNDAVAGTFVNDGVFSRFGEGEYDFYCDYTAIYKNENGEAVPYPIEKCTMNVTVADNGDITATATFIATDAVQYEVTMTSSFNKHLDYDAKTGAVDRTYTTEDKVTIDPTNSDCYFEVEAADGSDVFALYFFCEELDEEITIQPGTYTIDDTQDYMTVLASVGVMGTSVYPSFYAAMDEEGYLLAPLYFFVGGTVTVEKVNGQLKVEVNAVNSYDVPIHIVYDASAGTTAIEDIQTEGVVDVQKKVVDGQLLIIRNGKAYNAVGVQVK